MNDNNCILIAQIDNVSIRLFDLHVVLSCGHVMGELWQIGQTEIHTTSCAPIITSLATYREAISPLFAEARTAACL